MRLVNACCHDIAMCNVSASCLLRVLRRISSIMVFVLAAFGNCFAERASICKKAWQDKDAQKLFQDPGLFRQN